jgi:ComF family protein
MRLHLAAALEHALDWLAPPECPGCGASCPRSIGFCTECRSAIDLQPVRDLGGLPLLTAGAFAGPLAQAIVGLKYRSRHDFAPSIGRLVAERVGPLREDWHELSLVPVPLHPRRLAERGYNQSALVARALARHTGAGVACRALRRVTHMPRQATLGRRARLENVAGGFRPRRAMSGLNVALIDDVVTTGATLSACLAALQSAGATPRAVIAVARTDG